MTNDNGKSPTMDRNRGEHDAVGSNTENIVKVPVLNIAPEYIEANIIIKGNTCSECCNNVDLRKEAVQCFKCNNLFHANCFRDARDVCTQSALTNHIIPALSNSGSYEKRFGRFLFFCNFCASKSMTLNSVLNDSYGSETQLNTKVESLSSDVANLKTEMKSELASLKNLLSQALAEKVVKDDSIQIINSSTASSNSPASYADVANFPPASPEQKQQLLHISPNNASSLSTTEIKEKVENVKATITSSLNGIPTNFVKSNSKKGSLTVAFPDTETREKAASIISDLNLSTVGFHTKQGNKMLPKLTIRGIDSSIFSSIDASLSDDERRTYQKTSIVNAIISKNDGIKSLKDAGHTLDVVYLNQPPNSSKLAVGLKVSPAIRSYLFSNQQGKIFIGNSSLSVEDRFYFKQCYHCQQIGHFSGDCPDSNESSVCFYCMGSHPSKQCAKKQSPSEHCCAKCFQSKNPGEKANYKTHNAADPFCPVILREIQKIANNTDIHSKNVM